MVEQFNNDVIIHQSIIYQSRGDDEEDLLFCSVSFNLIAVDR